MRNAAMNFVMSSVVRVKKCPKCATDIPVACKRCGTCCHVFIPRRPVPVTASTFSAYSYHRPASRYRRRFPASRYSPEFKQTRSFEEMREMETDSSESSGKRRGRPRGSRSQLDVVHRIDMDEIEESEETLQPPKDRVQAFRLILVDINRKIGHRQPVQPGTDEK